MWRIFDVWPATFNDWIQAFIWGVHSRRSFEAFISGVHFRGSFQAFISGAHFRRSFQAFISGAHFRRSFQFSILFLDFISKLMWAVADKFFRLTAADVLLSALWPGCKLLLFHIGGNGWAGNIVLNGYIFVSYVAHNSYPRLHYLSTTNSIFQIYFLSIKIKQKSCLTSLFEINFFQYLHWPIS